MQTRFVGNAVLSLLLAVTCFPGEPGAASGQVPAPEVCADQRTPIPAETVVAIVKRLGERGRRTYVVDRTYGVFSFFCVPHVPPMEAVRLDEECVSAFVQAPVDVAGARARGVEVGVYDASACGSEEDAVWIQISPVVRHPVSGEWGIFVRTTPLPCMPIGGKKYWVVVESRERPVPVRWVELPCIEF